VLNATAEQLSFEQFWANIAEAMGIEAIDAHRQAILRDDLDFDSLDMAELVLIMDDLDCQVPEDLIPLLETVGDLYDHYLICSDRRPRSQR
jgi:acyl carrier protein